MNYVIVIFGSAASYALASGAERETFPPPRDVDVAWDAAVAAGAPMPAEIANAVAAWAAEYGLGDLPIDAHRVHCITGTPRRIGLPAPTGKECQAISIGDISPEISWKEYRTISATMRTHGSAAAAAILALDPHWEREINIDPRAPDEAGWAAYTEGRAAMISALRHAPGVLDELGEMGAFLRAWVDRGPSEAGVVLAARLSSGGAAKLLLAADGVRLQYGGRRADGRVDYFCGDGGPELIPYAEAERIFLASPRSSTCC